MILTDGSDYLQQKKMNKDIKWVETPTSSNVNKIGYGKNKDFYVEYITGKVYLYSNVPLELWNAAVGAPSIGKFLSQFIKGHYSFVEVS